MVGSDVGARSVGCGGRRPRPLGKKGSCESGRTDAQARIARGACLGFEPEDEKQAGKPDLK